VWLHNGYFDLVDLLDDPVFLGLVPKRRKFRRRPLERTPELCLMSHQHVPERHSVGPGAIRVCAALEQEERVCVGKIVIGSHCGAVKQQWIPRGIRPIYWHRGN
jgi:hypothetical protein